MILTALFPSLLRSQILDKDTPTTLKSTSLLQSLSINPRIFVDLDLVDDMTKAIQAYMAFDQPATSRPAKECRELVRNSDEFTGNPAVQPLQ